MVRRSSTSAGAKRFKELLDEEDFIARVVQLVYDTYGPGALPAAWDEFRCCDTENDKGTLLEYSSKSPFTEQFVSWLAYTWTPANLLEKRRDVAVFTQAPARTFLARHPDVDPLLARYLKACIATPFSFFEILHCDAGEAFSCCDLICGGLRVVLESMAATLLHAREILYARIVEVDGWAIMDAAAPWPFPEDVTPAILALREEILRGPGIVPPIHARQRLFAHELNIRSFYWGSMEQVLWDDSPRPPALSAMNVLQ